MKVGNFSKQDVYNLSRKAYNEGN
ncbi:hypothetical protein LCGC14_2582480, partial [marine sediment metagenome]